MTDIQAPSLFGNKPPPRSRAAAVAGFVPTSGGSVVAPHEARSLLDLLYDGFYMLFLLRNGHVPVDADAFRDRIKQFLINVERGSLRLHASGDDVRLAKFAYSALIDEVVLMSKLPLREAWERRPLQLEFFGEQLAGERFFEHLEALREAGAPKLQVLEVFHMCLLLGFQGRYVLEGSEKLGYLTSRVGDEIAQLRGKRAGFAPHWAPPDRVSHLLKREVPLWVVASLFGLLAMLAFTGLKWTLDRQTERDLGRYSQLVKLAPPAAHITITLP